MAIGATAAAVDGLIYQNRIVNPVPPALLEQRQARRLTIGEINQLNDEAIAAGMKPRNLGDTRTATERFLDLVDLPRNAMANIIWGEPDVPTIAGGIASVAGWGALYGSMAGSFLGPAGSLAGAAGGALVAGGVAAGSYAAGALAGGTLVGEDTRRQLASRARRGTFGAPAIYTSDALASMGVENRVVRAVVGFAGDVLLDPTTYLSGGGNVVAKVGSNGRRVILNHGGSRMLRQTADIVAKTGRMPTDPQLSRFADLFASRIRIGDEVFDVGEATTSLPRTRELIESHLAQVAKATDPKEIEALNAELAAAQRSLRTMFEREMVDLLTLDPAVGKVEAYRGKIARDFAREYVARSTHQITLPFGNFIANRLPGYHSMNLPVGGFGEPGRLARYLRGTEDEFVASAKAIRDAEIEALSKAREGMLGGRFLTIPQTAAPKMSEAAKAASTVDEQGMIRVPMTAVRFEESEAMMREGWTPTAHDIPFADAREIERKLDVADETRRQARRADLSTRLAKATFDKGEAEKALAEAKANYELSAALTPDSEIQRWTNEVARFDAERAILERDLLAVDRPRPLEIEDALDTMEASFREGDVATGLVGPMATLRRGVDAMFGRHGPKRYRDLAIRESTLRQEHAFADRAISLQRQRAEKAIDAHRRMAGEDPSRRLAAESGAIEGSIRSAEDSLRELREFEEGLPTVATPPPPKPKRGASKEERNAYKQARSAWLASNRLEHMQQVPIEPLPRWIAGKDRVVKAPDGRDVSVVRHETRIPASPESPVEGMARVSNKGRPTSMDLRFANDIDRAMYEAGRVVAKGDGNAMARAVAARRWLARTLGISEGKATMLGRRMIADIERQVFGFSPTALPARKALKLDDSRRVFVHGDRLVSLKELKEMGVDPDDMKPIGELLEPSDYITLSPVRFKEAEYAKRGDETVMVRLASPGTAAGHASAGRYFEVPATEHAIRREKIADVGMRFRWQGVQGGSLLPWDMTASSRKNLATLIRMGSIAREHAASVGAEAAQVRSLIDDIGRLEIMRLAAKAEVDKAIAPVVEEMNRIEESTPHAFSRWLYTTLNQVRTGFNLNANLRFKAIINKYRAASEEQMLAVKRKEMAWISKAVDEAIKATGAEPNLLDDAIIHRVVQIAMEGDQRSVVGFLPDDPFITFNLPRLREKAPHLIGNEHVEALARRIHETWNDFLQYETYAGVLADDVASVAYLPISMEERMRESWYDTMKRLGEPMRTAGANKLTTNPSFSLRRATNRMLYGPDHEDLVLALALRDKGKALPPDLAAKIGKANVHSGNSIFTGELWNMTPGDRSHPFEEWRLDFLRRMLDRGVDLATPRDRKLLGLPGGLDSGPVWMPQEFPTSPMMLNHSRDAFRAKGADQVSGNIFEEDILTLFSARAGQHVEAMATARFVEEVVPLLKPFGAEVAAVLPRGVRPGTVVRDGIEYRTINASIVRDDRLNLFSFIPGQMATERYYWPVAFADAVEDMARKLSSEAKVTGVLRGIQQVQSVWKGFNLFVSPSWWTGNMLSGGMMSHLIGGSRPDHWPRMAWLSHGLVKDIHTGRVRMDRSKYVLGGVEYSGRELKEMAIQGGVASAGRTMIEIGNLTRTATEPSGRFARLLRTSWFGRFYGWWFGINAQTDDSWRFITMLDLMDQGHSPQHAIETARLAHVDFGDFSFAEAKYGTLIVPFYRWIAGNMKLQLRTALRNPGYAAMFPKLREALEEGLASEESLPLDLQPKWMRDNIAVRIGGNENLRFAMLKTLTPAQELFELAAAAMGTDGLWEFMTFAAGSTNPILKFPAELAAQKELFSGRAIGDDPGAIPWATYWTNQIGLFRRFETAYSRLSRDQPDPVGEAARFVLGGSRIATTTPERLVAGFATENRQTTENLRARIRIAKRNGDIDEARQLAVELDAVWRRLYRLGYVDMVPRQVRTRFRSEERRRASSVSGQAPASR